LIFGNKWWSLTLSPYNTNHIIKYESLYFTNHNIWCLKGYKLMPMNHGLWCAPNNMVMKFSKIYLYKTPIFLLVSLWNWTEKVQLSVKVESDIVDFEFLSSNTCIQILWALFDQESTDFQSNLNDNINHLYHSSDLF